MPDFTPGGNVLQSEIRPDISRDKHERVAPFKRDIASETGAAAFRQYYEYQVFYDSFNRANSTSLGQSEDHQRRQWIEDIGNVEISGNALRGVTLSGGEALATTQLGYQEYLHLHTLGTVNSAVGGIAAMGLIFRVAGANDLLLAEVVDDGVAAPNGALQIWKRVAGTYTQLSTVQFGVALTTNVTFNLEVICYGPCVQVHCWPEGINNDNFDSTTNWDVGADTWTSILQTGQRVGARFTRVAQETQIVMKGRTW